MTKLVVIDGDIISYRCAAANEKRTVLATHNETLEQSSHKTMTDFKAWLSSEGGEVGDYTIVPVQTAGPIKNALHSLKQSILSIAEKAKCDSYHIVVSGEDNFRLDLPLPTRYKSNRENSTRPLQLKECTNYLIEQHEAEVSEGQEADDVLVGYAYQGYKNGEYVVQASLDKDAKHGPGWLFDWTTMDEPELITGYGELTCILKDSGKLSAKGEPVMTKTIKGKGRAFLWYQLVYGDVVDGYKPCELAKAKFGEVGAYELLKDATTDTEALTAIVRQYKKWYPSPVTYYDWNRQKHTKDWLQIMQLYADCCFMKRWESDRLDIPKLLTKLGVDY